MFCLPFRACERVRDFPSWGTVWLKRKLLKLAAQLKPKRFFQSVLHSSLPEKSLILAETLGSKGGLHVWKYNWNPTCNRFLRNLLLGAISCRGTHQPTEPPHQASARAQEAKVAPAETWSDHGQRDLGANAWVCVCFGVSAYVSASVF